MRGDDHGRGRKKSGRKVRGKWEQVGNETKASGSAAAGRILSEGNQSKGTEEAAGGRVFVPFGKDESQVAVTEVGWRGEGDGGGGGKGVGSHECQPR